MAGDWEHWEHWERIVKMDDIYGERPTRNDREITSADVISLLIPTSDQPELPPSDFCPIREVDRGSDLIGPARFPPLMSEPISSDSQDQANTWN